ncbi:hypothetical protein [Citrobacter sp. 172116965]
MFGKTKQALTRIGAFTLAVAAPAVFAAEGDVVGGKVLTLRR